MELAACWRQPAPPPNLLLHFIAQIEVPNQRICQAGATTYRDRRFNELGFSDNGVPMWHTLPKWKLPISALVSVYASTLGFHVARSAFLPV